MEEFKDTYDIRFLNDFKSESMYLKCNLKDVLTYVRVNIKNPFGYFNDYSGGHAVVYCRETGEIFETFRIP